MQCRRAQHDADQHGGGESEKARTRKFPQRHSLTPVHRIVAWDCSAGGSERGGIRLAGADADRVIEAEHENLAVADLAGLCRRRDGVDDLVDLVRGAGDLELYLRQETHGVFGTAINFGVTLLASVAFDLGDGQALNADLGQCVPDLVEFEWLDDGHDDFHFHYLPYARRIPGECSVGHLPRRILPHAAPAGHKQSSNVPTSTRP